MNNDYIHVFLVFGVNFKVVYVCTSDTGFEISIIYLYENTIITSVLLCNLKMVLPYSGNELNICLMLTNLNQ